MNLKISGFNIKLNGDFDDKTIRSLKDYEVSNFSDNIDLNINYISDDDIILNKNEFIGPYKMWHFKETDSGFEMAKFADGVDNALSHIIMDTGKGIATFRNWDISSLINRELYYMLFFGISEIYSYFIINKDAIMFHSSSIIHNDYGICFSGKSGTGKSTHTALWQKYYDAKILNDDSPTLKISDNKVFACGSPFAGSTGINTNKIVPLKGIIFLEQAKENSIRKLSQKEAYIRFFNETKKPIMKNYIKKSIEIFNKIYASVPMYILSCNISKEAVDLVINTLECENNA